MNYKLYLIESGLFNGINQIFYVENNNEIFEYFSPTNISQVDEHFYNTRLYTDCKPFAEFNNKKDLFDLIYYLTCDTDSKRYKEALKNEKLYEYFI